MDLEEMLARDLGAAADGVDAAQADLAGVRRAGARERRRRRVLGAGGVAAAAAAVALVATLATVLPSGGGDVEPAGGAVAPLGLAWSTRSGELHLPSGRTVQVDGLDSLARGASTVVVGTGGTSFSLVDDAGDEPRVVPLTDAALGSPAPSLDGSHVAWLEGAGKRLVLVSFAVDDGKAQRTPLRDTTSSVLGVNSVDDRGRVLLDTRSGPQLLWIAERGFPGVDADDTTITGFRLLADGRAIAYRGAASDLVDLGYDGRVGEVARLTPGPAYDPNPDASAYVALTGDLRALVTLRPDGSTSTQGPLPLPRGHGEQWLVVGWESAGSVVLDDATADGLDLVRCELGPNTCEPLSTRGLWQVG